MIIKDISGLEPTNISIYKTAFKHKSKSKENNERLEFLGDSILDAIVSETIYKHFPYKNEGDLSKLRSKMVSRNQLNFLGNQLNLLEHLKYKEIKISEGLQNFEGNTLEALIGAIYLDQGFENCKKFVLHKLIETHIDWRKIETEIIDHKSLLYSLCQKDNKSLEFEILHENLKKPNERFHIGVKIDNVIVAASKGKNKKIAEQRAAKVYLEGL